MEKFHDLKAFSSMRAHALQFGSLSSFSDLVEQYIRIRENMKWDDVVRVNVFWSRIVRWVI